MYALKKKYIHRLLQAALSALIEVVWSTQRFAVGLTAFSIDTPFCGAILIAADITG